VPKEYKEKILKSVIIFGGS